MSQHQRPAPDNKRYSRPPESTSGRFSDPGARGGDWPWRAILMLAVAVPAAGLGSSWVATRAALKKKLVDVFKTEA